MKKLSKVLVLVLSAIMVLAMSASVFAANPVTGSITITPPTGVDANATNTYKIYKVFDAAGNGTAISYKVMATKKDEVLPSGFVTDAAGNVIHGTKAEDGTITPSTATDLTAAEIAAIAAYVAGDSPVATVTSTGTANAVASNLPNGYYYITTSTGTVVTIDSTNPDAKVNDKNTVPKLDKKATGEVVMDDAGRQAIAQVGTSVNYEATITVGKGAKNYVFHDTMTNGLSLNDGVTVTAEPAVEGSGWYTIKDTPDSGDTLTITFKDGIAENTKITIKYSATVTSDALQTNPAKNTATISYGDENSNNSTPDSVVEVYNAKITVDKKDGEGAPLAGAGFVLKNAEGKYYKFTAAAGTTPAKVEWVDSEDAATELTTAVVEGKAQVEFTGLGAGEYTLHEKTVPDGYNAAADQTIEVKKNNEKTNLLQIANVKNESGATLPTTGGIGTTIFYVLGSLLVVGCGIVLVSRKRMQNNK